MSKAGLCPTWTKGRSWSDYFMPVGTSLGETGIRWCGDRAGLQKTPDIAAYIRRTGAELGLYATESFRGEFWSA